MGKLRWKEVLSRMCDVLVPGCGKEGECVSPIEARVEAREEDSSEETKNNRVSAGRLEAAENSLKRAKDSPECLDVSIWGGLDDHLLEKIIARLPFESLFRAPSLSKSWRQRFGSESFQHEVCSSTASWNSYAPVVVNCKSAQTLGYRTSSKRWYRLPTVLPTISYVPKNAVGGSWMLRAGCGSLLCWTRRLFDAGDRARPDLAYHTVVTNPFTKTSKELQSSGQLNKCDPQFVNLLSEKGSKTYKVIIGHLYGGRQFPYRIVADIHIFGSSDSSWTTDSYCMELNSRSSTTAAGGSAIINGVLYMLFYSPENGAWGEAPLHALVSYDLKDKIWKGISHLRRNSNRGKLFEGIRFSRILVRGADAMLVVLHTVPGDSTWEFGDDVDYAHRDAQSALSVHRLDLELGLTFMMSRAPREWIDYTFEDAVWHGDWIYIGRYVRHVYDGESLVYNVRTRKWHRFDSVREFVVNSALSSGSDPLLNDWGKGWAWTPVIYEPGLNPFLEV